MANRIAELRQVRAQRISEARQLLDAATAAQRELTGEERTAWEAAMADEARLHDQIEAEERTARAEETLGTFDRMAEDEARSGKPGHRFQARSLQALNSGAPSAEWRTLLATLNPEHRSAWSQYMFTGEKRALQVDLDTAGGFLVTPMQVVDQLIKAIDDQVFLRQHATVFAVPNADSLGVPTLDNDPADADWTSELGTGSEDSTMSFGRRELHPHPVAKRLKISRTLLRKVPNAEGLAMQRLGYKFAITHEKNFLTGTGQNQPLGVFTASTYGISTSRDVATGNSATAIAMNGLINAKYALKAAYWPRARWLFHRDAVKQIALLRDDSGASAGTGGYLWYPSVRDGEPDRLLGLPMDVSEYAPNTFTSALYVGILGDFSNYWIADSLALEMQRLVELYATTNQVALIGRMESDGMPVLEEAFVRVKLG